MINRKIKALIKYLLKIGEDKSAKEALFLYKKADVNRLEQYAVEDREIINDLYNYLAKLIIDSDGKYNFRVIFNKELYNTLTSKRSPFISAISSFKGVKKIFEKHNIILNLDRSDKISEEAKAVIHKAINILFIDALEKKLIENPLISVEELMTYSHSIGYPISKDYAKSLKYRKSYSNVIIDENRNEVSLLEFLISVGNKLDKIPTAKELVFEAKKINPNIELRGSDIRKALAALEGRRNHREKKLSTKNKLEEVATELINQGGNVTMKKIIETLHSKYPSEDKISHTYAHKAVGKLLNEYKSYIYNVIISLHKKGYSNKIIFEYLNITLRYKINASSVNDIVANYKKFAFYEKELQILLESEENLDIIKSPRYKKEVKAYLKFKKTIDSTNLFTPNIYQNSSISQLIAYKKEKIINQYKIKYSHLPREASVKKIKQMIGKEFKNMPNVDKKEVYQELLNIMS